MYRSSTSAPSPVAPLTKVEWGIYLTVVAAATLALAWKGWAISQLYRQGHELSGAYIVSPGWLPGLGNDLTDIQWRVYREALPKLVAALAGFAVVSRLLADHRSGETRYSAPQLVWRIAGGVIFAFVMHGAYALHVLVTLAVYYVLVDRVAGKRHIGPWVIWGVPAAVWLAARRTEGIPFFLLPGNLDWLDSWQGPVRWQIGFNLVMLRMVSWGLDLHWARLHRRGFALPSASSKGANPDASDLAPPHSTRQRSATDTPSSDTPPPQQAEPCTDALTSPQRSGSAAAAASQRRPPAPQDAPQCRAEMRSSPSFQQLASQYRVIPAKQRALVHHAEEWHNLPTFLCYCLYVPLYLTGPTITYNDFVCQLRSTHRASGAELLRYAARLLLCLLCLELLTHCIHANAFARFHLWAKLPEDRSREVYSGFGMAAMSFYKLIFLWLKFVVIWRVARLWALVEGVDPPENMQRCVCNNYDISGFWRTWHASFNRWLIRYMYVPLGGAQWRLLNVWPIFTFVALWHDFEWHLLKWAWLMALFIAPEVLCKRLIRQPEWRRKWGAPWFRHLCAAAAAVYITVMMAANLVGYGLGSSGVYDTLARVLGSPGTLACMLASFFCAAHIMLEHRRLTGQA